MGELSQIKVDLSVVSQLNDGSKRHANKLSNLADSLSSVTSQVDSQIKSRRSIGTRLRSSTQRVEEIGIKLKQIQTFISGAIERYGQLDKEIVSQSTRLKGINTSGDKQNWWDKLTGGATAGIDEIRGLASKAASEFESGVTEVFSNATKEALELFFEVKEAREKAIDFVEDTAKEAIEALESTAVGSFVEGVADAVTENVLLGIPQLDSDTDHQKSYLAGKIVGDLASEAIGFVEGMAAVGMEGVGVALDSTGIGAIAGVGLNVAGLVVLGHASSVMYNGASNLGKDAGDLVRSIRNGSSEGTGKGNIKMTEPTLPTGGKPKGNYGLGDSHGIKKQNETADLMADKGYDIEMLDEINGGNGYGKLEGSNPDYLIEGNVFDCYSPKPDGKVQSIIKEIAGKTKKQSGRIVLNLDNFPLEKVDEITETILRKANPNGDLKNLEELILVRDGKITRVFGG